jgi:adenylate cyclase
MTRAVGFDLPVPGGPANLRVGIGIATGRAFVGNVRAADRFIWTAIGNTTNLAARLQSLTRELDVAMIVDETTFARLGEAGIGFRATGPTRVRGRSEPLALYALAG